MNEHAPQEPVASNDYMRKRTVRILVIAAAGVVLVTVIIVFLFIDPFGWNLLGLRSAEIAAESIPSDVAFYMSMDLGNITCDDLNPIVWAFSKELEEQGKCALDELFDDLDKNMQDDWGLTFSDDVKPWLGRSIAMGWSDLTLDAYGGLEDVEMVFAIEVRKPAAADEFLLKMKDILTEEMGEQFLEETYQGSVLYYVDAPDTVDLLAFSRSDDMLLFGMGKNDVMAAIDAQKGGSLADTPAFRDTISELPSGRMLTIYMDSEHLLGIFASLIENMGDAETLEIIRETAIPAHHEAAGLYIVDAGIRMDLAFIIDPETVTEEMLTAYQNVGKQPHTDALMPDGSFVYRVGSGLNRSIGKIQENLTRMEGAEDFTESMMFFKMAFGFDPFEDFFARLDGEWAFGIVPSTEGFLSEDLMLPLGFVFLSETSDPEGLQDVSVGIRSLLEQLELGRVEPAQMENATLYDLWDIASGRSVLTYGVIKNYFTIGSSAGTLNGLFDGGSSLADSERYRQVWQEFPRDMSPVMFVDIQGLGAYIQESIPLEIRQSLEPQAEPELFPVTTLAIAGGPFENGVSKATVILFIETE